MIEIVNLTKFYKKRKILSSINLKINNGEIIGLIGENGSGKSTLLKILATLISSFEGTVYLDGVDIYKIRKKYLNKLGVFIERPYLFNELTGYENIKILSNFSNIENLNKVLNIFQCKSFINNKVKDYSLGMQQKIGLMISFLNEPEILLLDEPFNALDEASCSILINFLKLQQEKGVIIIISSHTKKFLNLLCDKSLIISNGILKEN